MEIVGNIQQPAQDATVLVALGMSDSSLSSSNEVSTGDQAVLLAALVAWLLCQLNLMTLRNEAVAEAFFIRHSFRVEWDLVPSDADLADRFYRYLSLQTRTWRR
eukprot:scaffold367426_cov48-Prasinocladus_malaysianus.AAC.2